VAEQVTLFETRRQALEGASEIAALRRRAENIRVAELGRAAEKLVALSPEERRAVEVVTAQIVN